MSRLRLIPPGGGGGDEGQPPNARLGCDEVAPYIVPFIDGQFDGEEAGEIDNHIRFCPHCRRVADAARTDRAHLRRAMEKALPESAAPMGLRSRIMDAIRSDRAVRVPLDVHGSEGGGDGGPAARSVPSAARGVPFLSPAGGVFPLGQTASGVPGADLVSGAPAPASGATAPHSGTGGLAPLSSSALVPLAPDAAGAESAANAANQSGAVPSLQGSTPTVAAVAPWARGSFWSWAPSIVLAVISTFLGLSLLSPQTGGTSTRALIEDSVRRHARNLPPEVADADPGELRRWFMGKLEFGIGDLPVRVGGPGLGPVRLVGARISHVLDRPAAQFILDRDGKRCSLMVFERPARLAPDGPSDGGDGASQPQPVGNLTVYASRSKGFNVLYWAQDTLSYTLVCDQPFERMLDGLSIGDAPGR